MAAESSNSFWYTRRFYVYEAAYLVVFSAWENLLEQALVRFLCGYSCSRGSFVRPSGLPHFRSLATAHAALVGKKGFVLWHDPAQVIKRCNAWLVGAPHVAIVGSAIAELERYATIRNHIAHRSLDTRKKFDLVALALVGQRISAGRAGRMLRISVQIPPSNVRGSWFQRICNDLDGLARQIVL